MYVNRLKMQKGFYYAQYSALQMCRVIRVLHAPAEALYIDILKRGPYAYPKLKRLLE